MAKKKLTLETLQAERQKLEQEVNDSQKNLAEKEYTIDFENISNLNSILTYIDKSFTWNLKNAALVVNLHSILKAEKQRLNAQQEDGAIVNIKQVDLSTLYTVLTAVQGIGVEGAKRYITLLTNVGMQITEAMNQLADSNRDIQGLHTALAELDSEIAKLKVKTVDADEIIEQK